MKVKKFKQKVTRCPQCASTDTTKSLTGMRFCCQCHHEYEEEG